MVLSRPDRSPVSPSVTRLTLLFVLGDKCYQSNLTHTLEAQMISCKAKQVLQARSFAFLILLRQPNLKVGIISLQTVSEPSVPPAFMIFLRLAQNAHCAARLNFQKIAMHSAHSIIKAFGEVIGLGELLR